MVCDLFIALTERDASESVLPNNVIDDQSPIAKPVGPGYGARLRKHLQIHANKCAVSI